MHTDILIDLTTAMKKLYTLEESIIYSDRLEHTDLRSKQALLISEVIQALQDVETTIKRETHFAHREQSDSLVRAS